MQVGLDREKSLKVFGNVPVEILNEFIDGQKQLVSEFSSKHMYPANLRACETILGVEELSLFMLDLNNGHDQLVDLGLTNCIQDMFLDDCFVKNLYPDENRPDAAFDWWGGSVCKSLSVNFDIHNPRNGCYEIFVDWFRPFQFNNYYSVGIVGLRSLNLVQNLRGKSRFHRVWLLIPGPNEPTDFATVYMHHIAQSFLTLGEGFEVKLPSGETYKHIPYFVGSHNDTPALHAVKNWVGFGSLLGGCSVCSMNGGHYDGATRWLGYSEPYDQYLLHGVGNQRIYAKDAPLWEQHMIKEINENPELYSFKPVRGPSPLLEVPTFDYIHATYVPVYHKLVEGVVQTFFKVLVECLNADEKKKVSERVQSANVSKFRRRAIKDIVRSVSALNMSELKDVICIYALFLFRDNPVFERRQDGPQLWRMLVLLHKSSAYMLTPRYVKDRLVAGTAQDWIHEFAVLAQSALHVSFFTHNLHVTALHTIAQEDFFGMTWTMGELWGERLIAYCKKCTKHHISREPHKNIAHMILVSRALARYKATVSSTSPNLQANGLFSKLSPNQLPERFHGYDVYNKYYERHSCTVLKAGSAVLFCVDEASLYGVVEHFFRDRESNWAEIYVHPTIAVDNLYVTVSDQPDRVEIVSLEHFVCPVYFAQYEEGYQVLFDSHHPFLERSYIEEQQMNYV